MSSPSVELLIPWAKVAYYSFSCIQIAGSVRFCLLWETGLCSHSSWTLPATWQFYLSPVSVLSQRASTFSTLLKPPVGLNTSPTVVNLPLLKKLDLLVFVCFCVHIFWPLHLWMCPSRFPPLPFVLLRWKVRPHLTSWEQCSHTHKPARFPLSCLLLDYYIIYILLHYIYLMFTILIYLLMCNFN